MTLTTSTLFGLVAGLGSASRPTLTRPLPPHHISHIRSPVVSGGVTPQYLSVQTHIPGTSRASTPAGLGSASPIAGPSLGAVQPDMMERTITPTSTVAASARGEHAQREYGAGMLSPPIVQVRADVAM